MNISETKDFFPVIMVCADWMHSRDKVRRKFPMINETMIQKLYGLGIDPESKKAWVYKEAMPFHFQQQMKIDAEKWPRLQINIKREKLFRMS